MENINKLREVIQLPKENQTAYLILRVLEANMNANHSVKMSIATLSMLVGKSSKQTILAIEFLQQRKFLRAIPATKNSTNYEFSLSFE